MKFCSSYAKAIKTAALAVRNCGWEDITYSSKNGTVKAKTKSSLRSWGEDVTITVQKLKDNYINVEFNSEPVAQLIDWGKGEENKIKFFKEFKKIIKGE